VTGNREKRMQWREKRSKKGWFCFVIQRRNGRKVQRGVARIRGGRREAYILRDKGEGGLQSDSSVKEEKGTMPRSMLEEKRERKKKRWERKGGGGGKAGEFMRGRGTKREGISVLSGKKKREKENVL